MNFVLSSVDENVGDSRCNVAQVQGRSHVQMGVTPAFSHGAADDKPLQVMPRAIGCAGRRNGVGDDAAARIRFPGNGVWGHRQREG